MKKDYLTPKLFSLCCENEKELLSKIIGVFTRPGFEIVTICQSQTDVNDIILITIEVKIPAQQVDHMVNRLRKIIGVFDITISFGSVIRSAMYKILVTRNVHGLWDIVNKYNARAVMQLDNTILIHQLGKSAEIQRLFNELDGPQLLAFHHVPLTLNQPSINEEINQSEFDLIADSSAMKPNGQDQALPIKANMDNAIIEN